MSDEGYPASAWEHTDNESSTYQNLRVPHSQSHPYRSDDSLPAGFHSDTQHNRSNNSPRSSVESPTRLANQRWTAQPAETAHGEDGNIVEAGFDENVLHALLELDCGTPLLLDRIKQSMTSCKEVAMFFKKRAIFEDEYGRNMQKLAKSTAETYASNEGKAGSFVIAWQNALKTHETIAENRLRFAHRLNEMSDELTTLSKEVEKTRKQTKDLATRYERSLQDTEGAREKAKTKFDQAMEELERLLLQKEGESVRDTGIQGRSPGVGGKRALGKAVAKGGMLLKGKNPGNIQRQEDEIRLRVSASSDAYRKAMTDAQVIRQEYFNFQLPRILRSLKECADEIDLGTQYHLTRYAFLYENSILSDGTVLCPTEEDPSLKAIFESIDNRKDFKAFMQNYAYIHNRTNPRAPRRFGPTEDGFVPPILPLNTPTTAVPHHLNTPSAPNAPILDRGRPTYGVDLAEQMTRDDVDVPPIMVKCCEAIEKHGILTQGVYRVGGGHRKVQELKEKLDRDLDSVNLDNEEWSSDISNVTSALKLWLRELPDPLISSNLQPGFIEATRHENERMRHIKLHERVNDLPDPNYATLKFFMGHLHKVTQHESDNSMSIVNLAIVFGPTLFGQGQQAAMNGNAMLDASWQNKAVETILKHYTDIFVEEPEQA